MKAELGNNEGYRDPTADRAIYHVMREQRKNRCLNGVRKKERKSTAKKSSTGVGI